MNDNNNDDGQAKEGGKGDWKGRKGKGKGKGKGKKGKGKGKKGKGKGDGVNEVSEGKEDQEWGDEGETEEYTAEEWANYEMEEPEGVWSVEDAIVGSHNFGVYSIDDLTDGDSNEPDETTAQIPPPSFESSTISSLPRFSPPLSLCSSYSPPSRTCRTQSTCSCTSSHLASIDSVIASTNDNYMEHYVMGFDDVASDDSSSGSHSDADLDSDSDMSSDDMECTCDSSDKSMSCSSFVRKQPSYWSSSTWRRERCE